MFKCEKAPLANKLPEALFVLDKGYLKIARTKLFKPLLIA